MNFIIEQYHNRSYLTYPLSPKDGTDPLLMGMLLNNRIPGFGEFSTRDIDGTQRLCYDIHGLHSMKDIFAQTVSRHILLNTFDRILAALEAAQDYMIEASSIVLDPQYIFLDPTTFRMALICLPLMEYRNGNDEKSFFKSIMFNTIFDYSEPCDHVARIMNDLNSSEFDPVAFRSLLRELGATESSFEESPAAEPDPFFIPDTLAPQVQNFDPYFNLPPVSSDRTALQEADAILSAALSHTEPPIQETEAPPLQSTTAPSSEAFGETSPVCPASDPLSIADQLLSAALAVDPIPQKDAPTPVKEAPVASSPVAEEAGDSARSRRARARREVRDSQSVPLATPVVEAPKVSAPPVSDPLDFLDSFATSAGNKRTDAMKDADAILSALELPTKDSKETPSFDLFSDLPTSVKDENIQPFDDSFSDFTTPIVTSRKKSGVPAPSKAPEPRKTASVPAPTREQAPAEEPFDFSTVAKKPAVVTDAMKIADDLLSAVLAGVAPTEPVVPISQVPHTPIAAEKPATAASLDLDSFSASPSKKTAAMLEAEAILDSLDLFAPEGFPASAPAEAPALTSAAAAPREESTAQQESVRKGGFFSKLRKKEEAPAPTPQVPAQPVIPYFGSDGETTVLNVSQQMATPAAPYLIRSSNGETIVLSKAVFRVGKDRDFVDYCIHDNSAISRRHANFMVRNGDIFIIDTNSTNHTYVNGVMIRSNAEVKLTHGDEIRLANEDFMLYCAGTL